MELAEGACVMVVAMKPAAVVDLAQAIRMGRFRFRALVAGAIVVVSGARSR